MNSTPVTGHKRALGVFLGVALLALLLLPAGVAAPRRALAATTVCINEFLPLVCATSSGGMHGATSQTFIEIYNWGTDPVDLSGWAVKAGSASFTIPSGTALASRAYYCITGVGLALEGEVVLLDASGNSLDQKEYDQPRCNLSFGRYPDGSDNWRDDLPPSPGGPNNPPMPTASPTTRPTLTRTFTRAPTATPSVRPSATPSKPAAFTPSAGTASATPSLSTVTATPSSATRACLSEFMPAPREVDWDGNGVANYEDEWIELYNPSAEEIDLQGWQLDDRAGGGSRPFTFPAGSHLGAGAYGVYYQHQTGLALNNDGDDVRFLNPLGGEMERTSYVLTAPDASYTRLGGCDGHWVMDQPPSPGQPNPRPPTVHLPIIYATGP